MIESIAISNETFKLACEIIKDNNEYENKSNKTLIQEKEKEREKIDELLVELNLKWLSKTDYTQEEYIGMKEHLEKKLAELKRGLKMLKDNSNDWLEPTRTVLQFSFLSKSAFFNGDAKSKYLICKIIGEEYILKDNILTYRLKPYFDPLLDLKAKESSLVSMLEPSKLSKNGALASVSEFMLPLILRIRTEISKVEPNQLQELNNFIRIENIQ